MKRTEDSRIFEIEWNGKVYEVPIDVTPYRHSDEKPEEYKERRRIVKHLEKLRRMRYVFKSQTNVEKILGIKGKTYIKNGENTNVDGNVADEGSASDTTGNNRSTIL